MFLFHRFTRPYLTYIKPSSLKLNVNFLITFLLWLGRFLFGQLYQHNWGWFRKCIANSFTYYWKELIYFQLFLWPSINHFFYHFLQKIRIVEQDGKTIKLQIVRLLCCIVLLFIICAWFDVLWCHMWHMFS